MWAGVYGTRRRAWWLSSREEKVTDSKADDTSTRLRDVEESVDFILEVHGGELASVLKLFLAKDRSARRVLCAFSPSKSQQTMAREAGVQQPAVSKALGRLAKKRILFAEVGREGKRSGTYRLSKVAQVFRLQEFATEIEESGQA